MDRARFGELIARITSSIEGQPLDAALAERLNREWAPGTDGFRALEQACRQAIEAGWMCDREAGGIRYGRVIKAGPDTHGFSVDFVWKSTSFDRSAPVTRCHTTSFCPCRCRPVTVDLSHSLLSISLRVCVFAEVFAEYHVLYTL